MDPIKFRHIYLDCKVSRSLFARNVLRQLPGIPVTIVRDQEKFLKNAEGIPLSKGKQMLWLTEFKGPMLKPCPATGKDYLCCRYWTLNVQMNCPLDCTYCILQTFLNLPFITLFVNAKDVIREIDTLLNSEPRRLFRMGTGELTDSLALDPLTRLNESLIRHALRKKMVLEIKTKTNFVQHLPIVPRRNIVLSWSLNPDAIVKTEEHKSASLDARLNAASAALKKGYRLGFHFDPLLMTAGWEKKYSELLDALTRRIPEQAVFWVSLGSFRYPPSLKGILDKRFPQTRITTGESVKGLDGKMRYFRPDREALYQKVYGMLRKRWERVFVYFCMENKTIWKKTMGFAPEDNAHLDYLFHKNIAERFPCLRLPAPELAAYQKSEI